LPQIYSILWASKHLNLDALNEFTHTMTSFFGSENLRIDEKLVDPDLKECFSNILPTFE